MPRPSRQSGPRSADHPLYTFFNSQGESRIARHLAENSTLPHSSLYRNGSYRGIEPPSVGTSLSVNKDRSTHIASEPALESSTGQTLAFASVLIPGAAISDFGCDIEIEGQNGGPIVDPSMHELLRNEVEHWVEGVLSIRQLDPQESAMLECPFNHLGCDQAFSLDMEQEWICHSLDHYTRDDFGLDRAETPRRNQCPFCLESFVHVDGGISWLQRMRHVVSEHHNHGESVARHARTDFMLYSHLWRTRVIDIDTFRDLCGPRAHPSYGVQSQTSGVRTPRATAETGAGLQGPEEAVSVIHKRRRGPRRPHR